MLISDVLASAPCVLDQLVLNEVRKVGDLLAHSLPKPGAWVSGRNGTAS